MTYDPDLRFIIIFLKRYTGVYIFKNNKCFFIIKTCDYNTILLIYISQWILNFLKSLNKKSNFLLKFTRIFFRMQWFIIVNQVSPTQKWPKALHPLPLCCLWNGAMKDKLQLQLSYWFFHALKFVLFALKII